jgi:hypothetical protein
MTRNTLRGASALAIGAVLLLGVLRAQSQYERKHAALMKVCEQEKAASGAGGAGAAAGGGSGGGIGGALGGLAGRFGGFGGAPKPPPPPPPPPSPEINLVKAAGAGAAAGAAGAGAAGAGAGAAAPLATPGSTLDLIIEGKFGAGTHFLFDSDFVEVVKENSATPNVYQATVRVSPQASPSVVQVDPYTAVTCRGGRGAVAMVIGGKYAWDLAAADGSRIVMRSTGSGFALNNEGKFEDTYAAEFYRPKEAKPHQVRNILMSVAGPGVYSLKTVDQLDFGTGNLIAVQQRVMQRMADPKTTDEEKERLSKEYEAALEKSVQAQQNAVEQMNTSCDGNLTWNGTAAVANLNCQMGTKLQLKGTMKPL